jgi:hypothetical protein
MTAAPNLSLTANRVLERFVAIDDQVAQRFKALETVLQASPEQFSGAEVAFLKNMVFLTAVEFALLRAVGPNGQFSPPLKLSVTDLNLAMMKCDTIEGRYCGTPARIVNQKEWRVSDIFLFTGDAEKYAAVDESFSLRSRTNPGQFRDAYYESFVKGFLKASPRAPLLSDMRNGNYARFEAVLVWAKLQFVTQQPEATILNDAPHVLRMVYG